MRRFACISLLVLAVIALSVSCNQEPDSAKRPNHSHSFTEENVSDKYLKSAATCTSKAVYYKSCDCGVKGRETFESGEPLAHVLTAEIAEDSHLASAATCTAKATYYKSCTACGANGTETFENGEKGSHNYVGGACSACGEYQVYAIGATGPAGGIIFYDCDADNTEEDPDGADNLKSDVCGWRYLEAAPNDIEKTGRGAQYEHFGTNRFAFGFFRSSSNSSNRDSNTAYEIGCGASNTAELVNTLADCNNKIYWNSSGDSLADYAAAKLCADFEYGGYDDWFLPSKGELYKMWDNLASIGVGSFVADDYWSSTEDGASYANYCKFTADGINGSGSASRGGGRQVRAVRAF